MRERDCDRGIEIGRVGENESEIASEIDSGIDSETNCVIDGEIACEIERGSIWISIE